LSEIEIVNNLAKVGVVGSNPIARSIFRFHINGIERPDSSGS